MIRNDKNDKNREKQRKRERERESERERSALVCDLNVLKLLYDQRQGRGTDKDSERP